jgi:hypothetical protein
MLALLRSPKHAWHRDLVARPETHAWVLNLYRAGEQHPELSDDYFPVRHAPWPWLRDRLARHAGDERRHVRMYTKAIERMEEPVEEMRGHDVFNEVIRSCTDARFRIAEGDAPEAVRLKIAHFCAHAYFLERRIQGSLAYHLDACERAGREAVGAVIAKVAEDEERHVQHAREAVGELVDRRTARALFEVHRRGERRANLLFSQRQVREFLARFACRADKALAWRVCAGIMERAADHV